MSRRSRRSFLAAAGTGFASALAGCSDLNPLSGESRVSYDESAVAAIPGDLPTVPVAAPVHPTESHIAAARERVRSLLEGTDVSRIPNAAVRHELGRERESVRATLDERDPTRSRVAALAGLTHPRSEAMFVDAGLAAFDGELSAADVAERRERHHASAEAFLANYEYVGPPDDPAGALTEHARITGWGHDGARLTRADRHHEYENAVLHVAELAQDVEWGRAYAADARRLREHYVSTLDDSRDFGSQFASVAASLVADVESHAGTPDVESVLDEFERDIAETPAGEIVAELALDRGITAKDAVSAHEAGREATAVVTAMRALATGAALADASAAIRDGDYGRPESVDPVTAERSAAVDALRTLLDTAPAPLARRLADGPFNAIENADTDLREDGASSVRYAYPKYAVANHVAAAAPAVVERVGAALGT